MSEPTVTPDPGKPKWYYNIWLVLVMIFFVLGPFALPLVWKHPRWSRGVKIGLTVVTGLYTIALVQMTLQMVRAVTNELSQVNSAINF